VDPDATSVYSAAVNLAARYAVDVWSLLRELRRIYDTGQVPDSHLNPLSAQIEHQTRFYVSTEEEYETALALIKTDGFDITVGEDGTECYVAEISYPKTREHLLVAWEALRNQNKNDFGFHYTPYNFDSSPEKSFFDQMLRYLNLHPDNVADIYFTGALTDANKTDFFIEYRDNDGRMRRYIPDFLVRRKDGKVYIVEIKGDQYKLDAINGEQGSKAIQARKLVGVDPERLRYEIIFTPSDQVASDQLSGVQRFVEDAQS
jgi:hypothetical protein